MALIPDERRNWMPAYALAVTIIITFLVGVRLLSRLRGTASKLGLDDGFISAAWMISMASTAYVLVGAYLTLNCASNAYL